MSGNLHRHLTDKGRWYLGGSVIVLAFLSTCTLIFNGGFTQ